jgi:hypothetical protein
MKFQATVLLEFQAGSIAEAGTKLHDAVKDAADEGMDAKMIELRTPPGHPPVVLPPVQGGAPATPISGGTPKEVRDGASLFRK